MPEPVYVYALNSHPHPPEPEDRGRETPLHPAVMPAHRLQAAGLKGICPAWNDRKIVSNLIADLQ